MTGENQVMDVIFDAMDEYNELQPDGPPLEKSADTVLFGESGTLDSIGLVNLIVAVEQRLEETCGVSLTLADEKAMSRKTSPFRTVQTLAEYAATRLQEEAGE